MSFSICKHLLVASVLTFFSSSTVSANENCTSIADLACEIDELSTMCELISASNATVDFLTNQVLTLFAPTDDAWLTLDIETVGDLVSCTSALNSVFAFHTVPFEEISSEDLICSETIAMGNGDESRTVCSKGSIYQKGSLNSRDMMPQIVGADYEACNGYIHLVDQVMLPKAKYIAICEDEEDEVRPDETPEDLATEELSTEVVPMEEVDDECNYIADTLCSEDDLSTACELINDYELYELLDGVMCNCSWTLFAPTDDAFDAIADTLLDLSRDEIVDILTFHAIQGESLYYDDLQCKELVEMANGDDSRTKCDKDDETGERYKIQKGAGQMDDMLPRIIETIDTCNGPIHKVNNVLLPKL